MNKKKKKELLFYIVISISSALFAWGVHFFLKYNNYIGEKFTNSGELGSYLSGTAGVLFSAATIVLLLYSIFQARQEINLQIDEMKGQKVIFEKQMNAISLQQVENTFFKLIDNHKKFLDSFGIENLSGVSLIDKKYIEYQQKVEEYNLSYHNEVFESFGILQFQPSAYFNILTQSEFYSPIFKSVILIIRFIDEKLKDSLKAIYNNEEQVREKINFYHAIFYHSLSNGERYFLGLFYNNNNIFSYKLPLQYTEFYDYRFPYSKFSPDRELPVIEFNFSFDEETYYPATRFSKKTRKEDAIKKLKEELPLVIFNQSRNSFLVKSIEISKNGEEKTHKILEEEKEIGVGVMQLVTISDAFFETIYVALVMNSLVTNTAIHFIVSSTFQFKDKIFKIRSRTEYRYRVVGEDYMVEFKKPN